MAGMTEPLDGHPEQPADEPAGEGPPVDVPPVDDGGPYGVFGEGKPRHIVGDSDEPPRRRPRTRP